MEQQPFLGKTKEQKPFNLEQFQKKFLSLWHGYEQQLQAGENEGIITSFFPLQLLDDLNKFLYHLEQGHITPGIEDLNYEQLRNWIETAQGRKIESEGFTTKEVKENLEKVANYLKNLKIT